MDVWAFFNTVGVCMCGFCTLWMCGAFCNIVGVCMCGYCNCVVVLVMGNSIL